MCLCLNYVIQYVLILLFKKCFVHYESNFRLPNIIFFLSEEKKTTDPRHKCAYFFLNLKKMLKTNIKMVACWMIYLKKNRETNII
jgi:hypothetical protein